MGVKQRNRHDYFSTSAQGSQGSQMRIEATNEYTLGVFDNDVGGKYKNTGRVQETVNDMGFP